MPQIKLKTSVSGSFSGVKGDIVTCGDGDAEGLVNAGFAEYVDEGDVREDVPKAKPARKGKKKDDEVPSADETSGGDDAS